MNEWWEAYLCLAKKVESGGAGNDYGPIEDFKEFVDLFAKHCPPEKQYKRVLNIGAGAGGETRLLVDAGYDVMGITLGRDNVSIAKEKYGIELIEMDMHYLNFRPNSFDSIFMIQTQEHALSSWIFALEMRFILRPCGRIFTDLPTPDNPEMLKTIWHTEVLYSDQMLWLMWKAGFKLVVDKSIENRYKYIFEKIPNGVFDRWGYVRHIMNRRLDLYEKEGARTPVWNKRKTK